MLTYLSQRTTPVVLKLFSTAQFGSGFFFLVCYFILCVSFQKFSRCGRFIERNIMLSIIFLTMDAITPRFGEPKMTGTDTSFRFFQVNKLFCFFFLSFLPSLFYHSPLLSWLPPSWPSSATVVKSQCLTHIAFPTQPSPRLLSLSPRQVIDVCLQIRRHGRVFIQ